MAGTNAEIDLGEGRKLHIAAASDSLAWYMTSPDKVIGRNVITEQSRGNFSFADWPTLKAQLDLIVRECLTESCPDLA
jgi:hypothetical protein